MDLNSLTVDPLYQRRGIGALMMDWGLQRARVEGVPVVLEATANGLGLYLKKGFHEVGKICFPAREYEPKGKAPAIKVEDVVLKVMRWDAA